jgi:hypothetical protein
LTAVLVVILRVRVLFCIETGFVELVNICGAFTEPLHPGARTGSLRNAETINARLVYTLTA